MRSVSSVVPGSQLATRNKSLRAFFLNASGQCSSQGSGNNNAINTARDEASGRRAHHRWSVEGCPCRIDFSRAACFETSAMGKSTSARRLQSLETISQESFAPPIMGVGTHSLLAPRTQHAYTILTHVGRFTVLQDGHIL